MTDNISTQTTVITANRLDDGAVVYFQSPRHWGEDLQLAKRCDGDGVASTLAEAKADAAAQLVVGVYDIAVGVVGENLTPLSVKEEIRALHKPTIGPSA